MGILAWLVVGLVAGVIAKALMPGHDPGGIIVTILLGIAGAIVGGSISIALGIGNGIDDFDIGTIVLAVAGAMLLLFGYRLLNQGWQRTRRAHLKRVRRPAGCGSLRAASSMLIWHEFRLQGGSKRWQTHCRCSGMTTSA